MRTFKIKMRETFTGVDKYIDFEIYKFAKVWQHS